MRFPHVNGPDYWITFSNFGVGLYLRKAPEKIYTIFKLTLNKILKNGYKIISSYRKKENSISDITTFYRNR